MISNSDIFQFIIDNIQKVVIPEEVIRLELSVSRYELVALVFVMKAENLTMSSLAQKMSVPMSTATGIVDRLVKKGLLNRARSEEDRRIVTVTITEKGKETVDKITRHLEIFFNRIRSVLTEEEFETGIKILGKVFVGL